MARRRAYRPEIADRISGVLAQFDGTCPRCDGGIFRHGSRVVRLRDEWIHAQCASGGDDQ